MAVVQAGVGDSSKFLDFVDAQLAAQNEAFAQIDPFSQQLSDDVQEKVDKNNQLLTSYRQQGGFTVKALITSSFKTQKTSKTGQGTVTIYGVNARLSSNSILNVDKITQGIVDNVDESGSPIYYVPVQCDLSKKKKEALNPTAAKKQQQDTEAKSKSLAGNISRKRQNGSSAATADQRKKQKGSDGKGVNNAEELANNMDDTPPSTTSKTSNQSKPPIIEDPSDSTDANTNDTATAPSSKNDGNLQQSDDGIDVQTPGVNEDQGSGVNYYYADQIHGTPYLGKPIIIWMPLMIGKDVTFFTDDVITVQPTPYSLVEMVICGSPYVDKKNNYKYNARSFTILEIKKGDPIPIKDLYQFFQNVGQSTFMHTKFHIYVKALKSGFKNDEEKMKFRFNDENSYWFVIGDELTAGNPLFLKDKGEHVWKKLERNTNFAKFQKNDMMTNSAVGVIPYKYLCMQYKGPLTPTNPTTMKYGISINIGAKHICPVSDKDSVPSLGITSLYAFKSIMPAIYPHIKMCIIAKEDMEASSKNNLNYDRFQTGITMGDSNWINTPYSEPSDRSLLSTFFLPLAISKVILLPIYTIRSVGIPITPEYFLKHSCENYAKGKFKPSSIEVSEHGPAVQERLMNKNDSLFCLSELSERSIQDIFTHHISSKEVRDGKKDASVRGDAYHFYAVANIFYRSDAHYCIPPQKHCDLSPEAGDVYIEALRNVVVKRDVASIKKNTFNKIFSMDNNLAKKLFPATMNDVEKFKAFLKWAEQPVNSKDGGMGVDPQKLAWLNQLDITDVKIVSPDECLCIYFYAIRVADDENWKDVVASEKKEDKIMQFLNNSADNNDSTTRKLIGDTSNSGVNDDDELEPPPTENDVGMADQDAAMADQDGALDENEEEEEDATMH